jgi:hypothetical protein
MPIDTEDREVEQQEIDEVFDSPSRAGTPALTSIPSSTASTVALPASSDSPTVVRSRDDIHPSLRADFDRGWLASERSVLGFAGTGKVKLQSRTTDPRYVARRGRLELGSRGMNEEVREAHVAE